MEYRVIVTNKRTGVRTPVVAADGSTQWPKEVAEGVARNRKRLYGTIDFSFKIVEVAA